MTVRIVADSCSGVTSEVAIGRQLFLPIAVAGMGWDEAGLDHVVARVVSSHVIAASVLEAER